MVETLEQCIYLEGEKIGKIKDSISRAKQRIKDSRDEIAYFRELQGLDVKVSVEHFSSGDEFKYFTTDYSVADAVEVASFIGDIEDVDKKAIKIIARGIRALYFTLDFSTTRETSRGNIKIYCTHDLENPVDSFNQILAIEMFRRGEKFHFPMVFNIEYGKALGDMTTFYKKEGVRENLLKKAVDSARKFREEFPEGTVNEANKNYPKISGKYIEGLKLSETILC